MVAEGRFMAALESILSLLDHMANAVNQGGTHTGCSPGAVGLTQGRLELYKLVGKNIVVRGKNCNWKKCGFPKGAGEKTPTILLP